MWIVLTMSLPAPSLPGNENTDVGAAELPRCPMSSWALWPPGPSFEIT